MSKRNKKIVFDKFDGRCAYCGCVLTDKNFTIDHIKPLCKGGKDTADNKFPSCRECNEGKGSMTLKEIHKAYPNEKFYCEFPKKQRKSAFPSQVLKYKRQDKAVKETGTQTSCVHQLEPLCLLASNGDVIKAYNAEKGKIMQIYHCSKCNGVFAG